MKLEVSAKDKKLLVYLLAVCIVAAAYMFGAKTFLEKTEANDQQITEMSRELDDLTQIYNNHDEYSSEIRAGREQIQATMEKFPGGFTQENTILMILDIEKNTGAWIAKVSFSEENALGGEETATEDGQIVTETESVETESVEANDEVVENTDEVTINASDVRAVKQDLYLDYNCNYDEFKQFIKYIENYKSRLFISDITSSFSVEANEVSGTLTLTQYAVYGTNKEIDKPDFSDITRGTDNIFTTLNGTVSEVPDNQLEIEVLEDTDEEEVSDVEAETNEPDDKRNNIIAVTDDDSDEINKQEEKNKSSKKNPDPEDDKDQQTGNII